MLPAAVLFRRTSCTVFRAAVRTAARGATCTGRCAAAFNVAAATVLLATVNADRRAFLSQVDWAVQPCVAAANCAVLTGRLPGF